MNKRFDRLGSGLTLAVLLVIFSSMTAAQPGPRQSITAALPDLTFDAVRIDAGENLAFAVTSIQVDTDKVPFRQADQENSSSVSDYELQSTIRGDSLSITIVPQLDTESWQIFIREHDTNRWVSVE